MKDKEPRIFNINKPEGPTSCSIVNTFKKKFSKILHKKIGHFGTLDPLASGILLLAQGKALRFNNFIHQFLPKTYVAQGILGIATSTGDVNGEIIKSENKAIDIDQKQLEKFLRDKFLGKYYQKPPHYSACKFQGRPLYKWAREGKLIEKAAKERTIYQIDLLNFDFPKIILQIKVSTGTYIRTFIEDMAQSLGTLGTLEKLQRTSIGHLQLSSACNLDLLDEESLFKNTLTVDKVILLSRTVIDNNGLVRLSNGMKLNNFENCFSEESDKEIVSEDYLWVQDEEATLWGMVRKEGPWLIPQVIFNR